MKKFLSFGILTITFFAARLSAQEDLLDLSLEDLLQIKIEQSLPLDIHHIHRKGEWMFSYKYTMMSMDGNRTGTDRISDQEVLQQFPVTPTDMTMQMHMIGFMYAPYEFLTVMGMLPYKRISMNHLNRMATRFATHSQGLGDIKLLSLWRLQKSKSRTLFVTTGVSIPTGSIDERDDLPTGPDQKLPYPMQLGSGTVDPIIAATAIAQVLSGTFGMHLEGTFRVYANADHYRLGDAYQTTLWYSHIWNDYISSVVRFDGVNWKNINGADPELNPLMVPTADASLRGRRRIDLGIGINFLLPKDVQFTFQLKKLIYQNLDGPQLENQFSLLIGVSKTFKSSNRR